MGISLLILGSLAALVGGLMIVVAAFRESMWWGLACLLIPLASIVFVILHWDDTRPWLFLNLGGLLVAVLGAAFLPAGELPLANTVGWESTAPASPRAREPLRSQGSLSGRQRERRAEEVPDGGGSEASPREDVGTPEPALRSGGARDSSEDDEPELLPEPAQPSTPRINSSTSRINPSLRPRNPSQTREEVISPERAGEFLHRLVEITKTDGERFKGRVRAVRGGLLVVERPVGGGSITFELPKSEVRRITISITSS